MSVIINTPKYFTPTELMHSNTALDRKIVNIPSWEQLNNLITLGNNMDKVRELLGVPIRVNSCFRGDQLNRSVGGSATSSHLQGLAIDFRCDSLTPKQICEIIRKSDIQYDQIIDEGTWVHMGFKLPYRMQYLLKQGNKYVPVT